MSNAPERMNELPTCTPSDTELTQPRSGPVRYELIDKDGSRIATNVSAGHLAIVAGQMFPDQEQDPDRTGKGYDIQVVGADR